MAYNFPQNPTLGQVYTFNERSWKWTGTQWIAVNVPTSTSAPVYFSAAAPANPLQGALWYDTLNESLKIWGFMQGDVAPHWINITSEVPPAPPPVIISASAPSNSVPGLLWYDTIQDSLKISVSAPGGIVWELVPTSSPPTDNPPVTVSFSPPTDPADGTLWYDLGNNALKVWHASWILISQSVSDIDSLVVVSASPPTDPENGTLWFDTISNILKIWTLGPQGGQWIYTTAEPGRAPPPVVVSASEPQDPFNGLLWYDTIHSMLNLRDNDATPPEWITLSDVAGNPASCTKTTISSSPPPNPSVGDFWYDSENSNLNIWYVDMGGGQWVSVVPYPQELVTVSGGTFTGPILAGYTIPNDPLAFVTVKWVQDYIAAGGGGVPINQLPDVDTTGLTNQSTLVYDFATSFWKTDTTLPDITNGGTY